MDTNQDSPQDPTVDKIGEALKAQRFQMLEDIARELSEGDVIFPTCFDAAMRLRRELQNADLPISRVAKIVALEPLISSRLMQLAGSALYSPDGAQAKDLQTAISRLGLDVVRTTALAIAMGQLMRSKETVSFSKFSREVWTHSLKAAAASRLLAQTYTQVNPDLALQAGLVHDLGAFYMLYRAAQYEELRTRPETVKHLIVQWHESIGVTLLSALGVSDEVIAAVGDHDQPRPMPEALRTLSDVVYAGNALAGTYLAWVHTGEDDTPGMAAVRGIRQRYEELLPNIDADAQQMEAVFS